VLVLRITYLFVLLIGVATVVCGDGRLVAHYPCDEGSGHVLHDATTNDLHGTIYGGEWMTGPWGTALHLDGQDDYVDCGAAAELDITEAGSIMLWFLPEDLQGGLISRSEGSSWGDERLVLAFNTYGGSPRLCWVIANGPRHQYGAISMPRVGNWSHLAMTFSGKRVIIYENGKPATSIDQALQPLVATVPLMIGKCQGLGKQFFAGLIDEVRIYNQALSHDEVLAIYKDDARKRGHDTSGFHRPIVQATPFPQPGKLSVCVDYALMGRIPDGTTFDVELFRTGSDRPMRRDSLTTGAPMRSGEISFDLQQEPPGPITVRVEGRKADGEKLGLAATEEVQWPKRDPRFSPEAGVKVLNNFVFELLNVESPDNRRYTVNNPWDGWLFISLAPVDVSDRQPTVHLDQETVPLKLVAGNFEAMRYVSGGPHLIRLGRETQAEQLIVRSIGDLLYSMYGANPRVPETGDYTWEFLSKYVLDHANVIIGSGSEAHENEIREWTSEGKRWMTQRGLPWEGTVDECYDYWANQMGMQHPLMHGIWADEFIWGEKGRKMCPIWCEAIRRLKANPQFAGKQFYAYTGSDIGPEEFGKTIVECDYRFAREWYANEQFSEGQIRGYFGPQWERNNRAQWERVHPRAAEHRLLILGLLSQPEESCDIYPHCNFNAFLDMQFQYIATEPAFFGLRGLQGYYSPYEGEEQTRLFARLLRHYAIEGRSDRMLPDPYTLSHIENPDFLEGTEGWRLSPATAGSIAPKTAEGFGWLQGRYTRGGIGDSVLWTKRSAQAPNSFSQHIRNLEPGRLYSLRFFTGNYQDLLQGHSRVYKHAISVTLENTEPVPEKEFQALIRSNYAHTFGPFDRDHPYRSNYHQHVFRAKEKTARLVLSDWTSREEPGGPGGEELIWNFMQIQPYFPD